EMVTRVYAPIMESKGASLKVFKNWKSSTVNAYVTGRGKVRKITMLGGLARHKSITPDGLAYVVCHELGHHLGGFPKKTWPSVWSNEGQADYFANLKCLRKVFLHENNSSVLKGKSIPPIV